MKSDVSASRQEEEESPAEKGVGALEVALRKHSLINLIGGKRLRRQVLAKFVDKHRCPGGVYRLDGRFHDQGELAVVLRRLQMANPAGGAVVLLDQWEEEFVRAGMGVAAFQRWLDGILRGGNRLVLATTMPLSASSGGEQRRLIPVERLAKAKLIRCENQSSPLVGLGLVAGLGAAVAGAKIFQSVRESREEREDPEGTDSIEADKSEISESAEEVNESATRAPLVERVTSVARDFIGKVGNSSEKDEKTPPALEPAEQDKGHTESSEEPGKERTVSGASGGPGNLNMLQSLSTRVGGDLGERMEAYREFQRFESKLHWMEPEERTRLVRQSPVNFFEFKKGQFLELANSADNARIWFDFIGFVSDCDPRIAVESEQMGLSLKEATCAEFAMYLVKVGYAPEEFMASLFRTSDLARLFPEFQPATSQPSEFLSDLCRRWHLNEELAIERSDRVSTASEKPRTPKLKEVGRNEGASKVPKKSGEREGRPVRSLYALLVELDDEEALATNLESLEDFASLVGPREPRFCEWVYSRMEKRNLVEGLAGELIKRSDEIEMRKKLGMGQIGEGQSWPESLREVLEEVGVFEPKLPPYLDAGMGEILKAAKILGGEFVDGKSEAKSFDQSGCVIEARKGLERYLKLFITFLWNGGLSKLILEVVIEERQGFSAQAFETMDLAEVSEVGEGLSERSAVDWQSDVRQKQTLEEIQSATAGVLNHLLRAVSKECVEQSIYLPFLRESGEPLFWPEPVFQRIRSLLTTLNKLSHDSLMLSRKEREQHRKSMPNKLRKFMALVEDKTLRVPEPVQFFRRHDDGHGIHYEGYSTDNKRLWFYEVEEHYELGEPYVFLAATNPAAVDMTCVPFPEEFRR